jgi:hypothetical protein
MCVEIPQFQTRPIVNLVSDRWMYLAAMASGAQGTSA